MKKRRKKRRRTMRMSPLLLRSRSMISTAPSSSLMLGRGPVRRLLPSKRLPALLQQRPLPEPLGWLRLLTARWLSFPCPLIVGRGFRVRPRRRALCLLRLSPCRPTCGRCSGRTKSRWGSISRAFRASSWRYVRMALRSRRRSSTGSRRKPRS